jgi:pyruvate/2-oxoglutarate dehydrogenase complex dihydrolipoamide dehydrogenase (E3) component
LRSAVQAEELHRVFSKIKSFVSIGGGVQGIEVASQASLAGLEVSIVHRQGTVLNRHFPEDYGMLFNSIISDAGVQLHLNQNTFTAVSDFTVYNIGLETNALSIEGLEKIISKEGFKPMPSFKRPSQMSMPQEMRLPLMDIGRSTSGMRLKIRASIVE